MMPILVVARADTGGPLTMAEVDERLTERGIEHQADDAVPDREIVSPPTDWLWGERTCAYVAKMINGWATDTPTARNPWYYGNLIRLACAHRLGCITAADHQCGRDVLAARLTELVATTGSVRPLRRYEIPEPIGRAIAAAAAKTDAEVRAELGNHPHPHSGDVWGNGPPPAPPGGHAALGSGGGDVDGSTRVSKEFFDRDGLQARDLADAVTRLVTCGLGAIDERLYTYDNGVWTLNNGHIETVTAQLLGNRYRNTHCRNVLDLIRYSPNTPRITRDPNPEFINVRNGMIRWADADGRLHPHAPEYRSTVQLPVDYSPDATCPAFEQYLAQVLPKDCYEVTDDSPGFIWELIGYCLYSGNPLHIAVLLYGNGRNGKGVLIRVLKRLIGERNCSTVTLHELVENRFRAATLFGKLANLAGDLDARWLDNTATFKAITGGDTIQGEHKYGAVFDFQPWALPVYSTNKAFGSADSSEGWVARWVVVPFPRCFIGHEDRDLDVRLQTDAELRGILRRAVDALPALMKRGRLPEPDSVSEAKKRFIVASDAVRSWLDDQCVLDPDAWTDRTVLYRAYGIQTEGNGAKRLSAREFYARLEQVNGLTGVRKSHGRGFEGVRLIGIGDS